MTRMNDLASPLTLPHAPALSNRFALAPMTNGQSHVDGTLGDDEYHWLTMRAAGGFGLTMTCAATVEHSGVGFGGQLGIYDDRQLDGLKRLADGLKAHGTHAVVQLHHAGMRTPPALSGRAPQCPSDDEQTGAKAMSLAEVERTKDAFVAAARRAEQAGFDGVELHGAHGYLLCEFLSPELNRRTDDYGGPLANRSRILFDLVDAVRATCRPTFSLGVRLSPERFGLKLGEIREVAQRLMRDGRIDYLDMSFWDTFKAPEDAEYRSRPLVDWFTDLDRGTVRLGGAGKLMTGDDVTRAMAAGLDFVLIGRAGILHHDFPRRVIADPHFASVANPVTPEYLRQEGLSETFVTYMRNWKGFVTEVEAVTTA